MELLGFLHRNNNPGVVGFLVGTEGTNISLSEQWKGPSFGCLLC
jgi:hypothetical protein